MTRLRPFAVHKSAFPFSALGAYLETIEAPDADAARRAAQERHPRTPVVVIPATTTTRALEQACARFSARRTKQDRWPRSPRRSSHPSE